MFSRFLWLKNGVIFRPNLGKKNGFFFGHTRVVNGFRHQNCRQMPGKNIYIYIYMSFMLVGQWKSNILGDPEQLEARKVAWNLLEKADRWSIIAPPCRSTKVKK